MDEAHRLGMWRYVVELRGVSMLKRPMAALGKKLNEGTVFEFKLDGVVESRMGSVNQPAKWSLDDSVFAINTGYGDPSVGDYDVSNDSFLMRCDKGEFGGELSKSLIRLVRMPS